MFDIDHRPYTGFMLNTLMNGLFSIFFQPIENWTPENVVDWMACVRLYRYAQIFKDNKINGTKIKEMDPEKLGVNICPTFCIYFKLSQVHCFVNNLCSGEKVGHL